MEEAHARPADFVFPTAWRSATEVERHDLGERTVTCPYCAALLWPQEIVKKKGGSIGGGSLCCHAGWSCKLKKHFKEAPPKLKQYLTTFPRQGKGRSLLHHPRLYNNALSMASTGLKIDQRHQGGLHMLTAQGSVHHRISSPIPAPDMAPKFLQIYMLDGKEEQIRKRMAAVGAAQTVLDEDLLGELQEELMACNIYVRQFRTLREQIAQNGTRELEIKFVEPSHVEQRLHAMENHPRRLNAPSAAEMAILIPSDEEIAAPRQVRLELRGQGQYENCPVILADTSPLYDPLHFVLLYPNGEYGWFMHMRGDSSKRPGSGQGDGENQDGLKRDRLTALQFAKFFMHDRPAGEEHSLIRHAGRLFEEWILDSFLKVERQRLDFFKTDTFQQRCRSTILRGLEDAVNQGETDPANVGRMNVLPRSFNSSPRFMVQKYQDAMALVREFGKPDLFITMTCNPKWPEIVRCLQEGQQPNERPDLIARVFHLKHRELMNDISKRAVFGPVKGYVWSIEFQKRGLPHCHMLVMLEDEFKPRTAADIDRLAWARLPDKVEDPRLWSLVTKHMMHGPCDHRCLKDGVCTKKFPKELQTHTTMGKKGYALYKRPHDGQKHVYVSEVYPPG